MKDFLGNELTVGDKIVVGRPKYRKGAGIFVDTVINKLTDKMVGYEYKRWANGDARQMYRKPEMVIKHGT